MLKTISLPYILIVQCLTFSQLYGQNRHDTPLPAVANPAPTSLFSLDPLKKKNKDEKHFFWEMGGWYGIKTGNTENINSNGIISFKYDDNISVFSIDYSMFYDRTDNALTVHNGKGIINYDYHITQRIELFLFSVTEYNEITNLDIRNNTGAGVKFVFVRNKRLIIDTSFAPVYQYEKYNNDPEYDTRASFREKLIIKPFNNTSFSTIIFYVPKFSDFTNYRTDIISQVEIKIKQFSHEETGLFFAIGYQQNYNSTVPAGTKKTDRFFFSRLTAKL